MTYNNSKNKQHELDRRNKWMRIAISYVGSTNSTQLNDAIKLYNQNVKYNFLKFDDKNF